MGSSQSTVSTTNSFITIKHPQTGTTVLELKENFKSSGSSVLTVIKLEMDLFYQSLNESIASSLLLERQNMEHDHLPPYLGTTNKSVSKDITPAGGSQGCWARFNVFDGQITREVVHILICTSYTSTDASTVQLMMAQDVKQVERLFESAVFCVEALAGRQIRRTD